MSNSPLTRCIGLVFLFFCKFVLTSHLYMFSLPLVDIFVDTLKLLTVYIIYIKKVYRNVDQNLPIIRNNNYKCG